MQAWKKYEETARNVLEQVKAHFGLSRVEGKQEIAGVSKTDWEIDAKGIEVDTGGTVIIECRLRNRPQNQEAMAALAFRIQDTGSVGGIIVTPCLLQKGASLIASSRNIRHVKLNPASTASDFAFEFIGNLFIGVPSIGYVSVFGTPGISRS